ncbi:MAG TPA: Crp/Fnr family transcriptional regulator [Patescibacteria group bacterium]|nr:Crp/Fnr family transcriptional regulator [Patescibacteria group bacterium]
MATDIAQHVKSFFSAYPVRQFDKGEMVIQAEDPLTTVFYITEGRVSQYDITPTGNVVVVNVFKPGAFFPMSSAMNDTPNHYFFEAATKVTAHLAPTTAAVQFLKDNPDVLFDLLGRVYRGMDGVLRRMAHLMGGDSKSRLQFELLNAAYRFGEQQADGSIFISLKESDIAKHSGLARETVNRTMQSLKSAGLVEIQRNGMVIKSVSELEKSLGTEL